tara:strand:+ start:605 stop:808 length:204 start_codon:yes stop_codon:yes gene_type:complete
LGLYILKANIRRTLFIIFYGNTTQEQLIIDDQEIDDAGWFAVNELPENCAPKVQQEIALYNDWKYGK